MDLAMLVVGFISGALVGGGLVMAARGAQPLPPSPEWRSSVSRRKYTNPEERILGAVFCDHRDQWGSTVIDNVCILCSAAVESDA